MKVNHRNFEGGKRANECNGLVPLLVGVYRNNVFGILAFQLLGVFLLKFTVNSIGRAFINRTPYPLKMYRLVK